MSELADYSSIDPILEGWAKRVGLNWDREYKGYDVRSISWPLAHPESVQVWVDPPVGNEATIHVAHNSGIKTRRRTQQITHNSGDLDSGLDQALQTAQEWQIEAQA